MKDIWLYQAGENGLPDSDIDCIVLGENKKIYASSKHGIFSSDNSGQLWLPRVLLPKANAKDMCVNQRSGALLFSTDDGKGLYFQPLSGGEPRLITREKDGIASNFVASVVIDQSAATSTSDELGPVVIAHYAPDFPPGNEVFNRTLSFYEVETKMWRSVPLPHGFIIWRIRIFNGTVYVCTKGGLAISDDWGRTWNYLGSFSAPIRPPLLNESYSSQINDIYVDVNGDWYVLCVVREMSWFFRSRDRGETWEMLGVIKLHLFLTMEASSDNLFVLDQHMLRVIDKRSMSVKGFGSWNGLDVVSDDAEYDQDRFVVGDGQIFIPTNRGVAVATLADVAEYPPYWQYATTAQGLPDNTVLCVTGSPGRKDVSVLAGTKNGLALSRDGGQAWKSVDSLGTIHLGKRQINDLCYNEVPTTSFYGIATEGAGFLFCSDPASPNISVTQYTTADGLASNRAVCVFTRMYTTLQAYVGHAGEGLSWYDGSKWTVVNRGNGLAGNYVLSIRPGWYQEKWRLYACGYDDSGAGLISESAALSFSEDGGSTWTPINQLSFDLGVPIRFFDIWSAGYPGSDLYGLLCARQGTRGELEGYRILLAKSVDGGRSWNSMSYAQLEQYEPGVNPGAGQPGIHKYSSNPKLVEHNGALYISTSSALFHLDLKDGYWSAAYWEAGLREGNRGAPFIDADGRIYLGSLESGVALSNLEYLEFSGVTDRN